MAAAGGSDTPRASAPYQNGLRLDQASIPGKSRAAWRPSTAIATAKIRRRESEKKQVLGPVLSQALGFGRSSQLMLTTAYASDASHKKSPISLGRHLLWESVRFTSAQNPQTRIIEKSATPHLARVSGRRPHRKEFVHLYWKIVVPHLADGCVKPPG